MDERTQGALLLAVGGVALRLGLTDAALTYVRPGLRPLLVVAGVVLLVLGGSGVARAFRTERVGTDDGALDHAHVTEDGHAEVARDGREHPDPHRQGPLGPLGPHGPHGPHGLRVAWLLVLPLLALLLVAPPPLGAFAANRQSAAPPVDTRATYAPLPAPVDGAVELPVVEFVFRALYDEQRSLEGVPVRLRGFVSDDSNPEGYVLSRFIVSCCAADGRAVSVAVVDPEPPPPVDSWVELEGVWRPRAGVEPGDLSTEPPVLEVERRTPIEPPAQPYEF